MDKEEALVEFLKGLRIVLNNSCAYSKDHPYFVKSVDNFKEKIWALFSFLEPVKLDIAPKSLFLDGRYWEKSNLYVELAQVFHARKIKGVEFRRGLTVQELKGFFGSVSLPVRDILRSGGLQNILQKADTPHIRVDELEYSQFLNSEGEEVKDILIYLFREAIEKEDMQKINEFADNFGRLVKNFKAKDLTDDDEVRQHISNFLGILKSKQKDKFFNCAKQLLGVVVKDKNIPEAEKLDKLKSLFKDLSNNDFSEALLDQLSNNQSFDYLSFSVFSKLIDENKHKGIAESLGEKIKSKELLKKSPKMRKKIKEIFSGPQGQSVPEFYRHALSWIANAKETDSEDAIDFGKEAVVSNYRLLLLNLLTGENEEAAISLISGFILKEAKNALEGNDLEYLKDIFEILDKKTADSPFFAGLIEKICALLETAAFEKKDPAGIEYFADKLQKSSLGVDFYFNKIFNEGKVNHFVLRLFLKLFPESKGAFCAKLEEKKSDMDFTAGIVNNLSRVDNPASTQVLKDIFSFSNKLIKIEVLRVMRNLSAAGVDFFLPVLKDNDTLLKKEAAALLIRDEATRYKVLEELFLRHDFWGRRNKPILENIKIIEEIGLKDAGDYLLALSRKPFFWNRNVRTRAAAGLRKLAR